MAREDEQDRTVPSKGSEWDAATHKGAIDPADVGAVRLNPLTAPGQFAAGEEAGAAGERRDEHLPTGR